MRALFTLLIATLLLGGCSTIKKFTGQRNDTVLPGQREDILSPDQTVNEKIAPKGNAKLQTSVACDPNVDICPDAPADTSIDQEAGAN